MAITFAVKAGGGVVFFPDGTYLCRNRLVADSSVGVTLAVVGSETSGREAAATVRYTGRSGPFISARLTQRFSFQGLAIFSDNPQFTDVVVDLSHAAGDAPADSAFAWIEDCVIMGGNLLLAASALVSLDRAMVSTIRNCNLGNAQTAILGATDERSHSNAIHIQGCHLTNTVAAPITNPGSSWLVEGCSFAPRSAVSRERSTVAFRRRPSR